jgi:hypothetical protein
MATISLSELRPERHTIEFSEEKSVEFKSIQELTSEELAQFEALIADTQEIAGKMRQPLPKGTKSKQDKMLRNVKLAAELEEVNDHILQLLAVGNLNGELSALSLGVKANIIGWLSEQSKKKMKESDPQSES